MNNLKPSGLILDFDGVFTDNFLLTDSHGNELIRTSKYDSLALKDFKSRFPLFPITVISSETNNCVIKRCQKLKINLYHSVEDKVTTAKNWSKQNNIDLKKSIFLCNDINDIELCKIVGFPIGVADCNKIIKPFIKQITSRSGGNGAIAEVLNLISNILNDSNLHKSIPPTKPINRDVGFREWGKERLLFLSPSYYTVKELFIKKGFKGGLQMHRLKDESAYIVSGKLLLRFDEGDGILKKKIFLPGESIRFEPGCVHQEEALEDTLLIECSTPHFNDRIRMESHYDVDYDKGKGLPTTNLFDIEIK